MWPESEGALIASAKAGDGGAFAELIRPAYMDAFRLAFGLIHDRYEAEDVVQDAAFKAWRKIDQLRAGATMRPWFLGIVANVCRSRVRVRWWSVIRTPLPPEVESDPEDVAANLDIRMAVARLGYDQRVAIMLRYYLDLPFEEVAAALGISPKAARSRVERAIERLRSKLRPVEATC
jgi:RNA polymerase sigma-70 factor, ECF subfamily